MYHLFGMRVVGARARIVSIWIHFGSDKPLFPLVAPNTLDQINE